MKRTLGTLVCVFLLCQALTARGVVVDFDDFDTGGGVASAAADRYGSLGVVFSAPIRIANFMSLEPLFAPAFVAGGATAPNALAVSGVIGFQIDAFFVVPGTDVPATVNTVEALFGDTEVGSSVGTLQAFDGDGSLLDSATMTTPVSQTVLLQVAATGIARVSLSVDADGADVDNLTFPVPTVCPGGLRTGCRSVSKSLLLLKNNATDDTKDKLVWKWLKGAETSLQDLGAPTDMTNYTLCLYAGSASASVALPAGSNWQPAGKKGYKFKDKSGTPNGAQKALLKSGDAGKAKALVKGKGTNLPDTLLPGTLGPMLPLPVTVQLVNDTNSTCFEAVYDSGDVIKNDAKQFKAKTQ